MSSDDLLSRAKRGLLSPGEVQSTTEELRRTPADSQRAYQALHILGLMGATEHRALVESYLESPRDPMLARIALVVLCNHWGLAEDYRDALEAFVRGVAWDEEDDVRLVAISAAGELSRETGDLGLIGVLLSVATDGQQRVLLREAATSALARATGVQWEEIPSPASLLDPESSWSESVHGRARELIGWS